jgi:hypothetical protein
MMHAGCLSKMMYYTDGAAVENVPFLRLLSLVALIGMQVESWMHRMRSAIQLWQYSGTLEVLSWE